MEGSAYTGITDINKLLIIREAGLFIMEENTIILYLEALFHCIILLLLFVNIVHRLFLASRYVCNYFIHLKVLLIIKFVSVKV